MSESVVLCEGYLDRAFWSGWLEYLGCRIPGKPGEVTDALGRPVSKGQYLYESQSGQSVRIVPCRGRSKIQPEARDRLKQRKMRPLLTHLVINIDPDTHAHTPGATTGLRRQDVHLLVSQLDPAAAETENGDIAVDGGATRVSLVRWEASDHPVPGVPAQQTLERLVCAALTAAYPDRGPAVQKWLDSRPGDREAGPKEFGWSHMAGWYADAACEGFYRVLWSDRRVVAEMRLRLEHSGAWRIAEALAD